MILSFNQKLGLLLKKTATTNHPDMKQSAVADLFR